MILAQIIPLPSWCLYTADIYRLSSCQLAKLYIFSSSIAPKAFLILQIIAMDTPRTMVSQECAHNAVSKWEKKE